MKKERYNFVKMLIGHNRTGKSALARLIAEQYKKNNPNNQIKSFDPQRKFKDITDVEIFELEQLETEKNSINTLFIFDDHRAFHPDDKTNKNFARMMYDREEFCNDIILICHDPSHILNRIASYVTDYYLFYTMSKDDSFKSKVLNYETLIKMRNIINSYTTIYGKGGENEYPDKFPYIRYQPMNDIITYQNFTYKKTD